MQIIVFVNRAFLARLNCEANVREAMNDRAVLVYAWAIITHFLYGARKRNQSLSQLVLIFIIQAIIKIIAVVYK